MATTLAKHGSATNLLFGSTTFSGLTIVNSMSAEQTYSTEIFVKSKDGDTTGLVQGDKRTSGSVGGYAAAAPSATLGSASSNPTGVGSTNCVITSLRMSGSNEDFQTFELGFQAFEGITIGTCDRNAKHDIAPLNRVEERTELSDLAFLVQELQ
jgi:hypothetical protein